MSLSILLCCLALTAVVAPVNTYARRLLQTPAPQAEISLRETSDDPLVQPDGVAVNVLPPANTLQSLLLDELAPAVEPIADSLDPFFPEDPELYFGEVEPENRCPCTDVVPENAFSCQEIVPRLCISLYLTLLLFLFRDLMDGVILKRSRMHFVRSHVDGVIAVQV